MNPIQATHQRSIQQKDAFWREEAAGIHWEAPFTEVLDYSTPPSRAGLSMVRPTYVLTLLIVG